MFTVEGISNGAIRGDSHESVEVRRENITPVISCVNESILFLFW